jgi:hypothetical protein
VWHQLEVVQLDALDRQSFSIPRIAALGWGKLRRNGLAVVRRAEPDWKRHTFLRGMAELLRLRMAHLIRRLRRLPAAMRVRPRCAVHQLCLDDSDRHQMRTLVSTGSMRKALKVVFYRASSLLNDLLLCQVGMAELGKDAQESLTARQR